MPLTITMMRVRAVRFVFRRYCRLKSEVGISPRNSAGEVVLVPIKGSLGTHFLAPNSCRTIFAPSTIACIFLKATSRGRYFNPQSGATTIRSAGT
jgi:hypothetical protein